MAQTLAPAPAASTLPGGPRVTPGHPCALWDNEDIAAYKRALGADPDLKAAFDKLRAWGDERITEPLNVPTHTLGADGTWAFPAFKRGYQDASGKWRLKPDLALAIGEHLPSLPAASSIASPYGVSPPSGKRWTMTFDDEFTQDASINRNKWNGGAGGTDWCNLNFHGKSGGAYMFAETNSSVSSPSGGGASASGTPAHADRAMTEQEILAGANARIEKHRQADAVVIATPDHTHAVIAGAAIKAGKHVYCEKPLTHTLFEARTIARLAKEAKVATQMGNQGHATESIRQFCEWVWDGAIGTVREVHAWTPHAVWPQDIDRPKETPPVPDTLDWDLWLGPAPTRPYHPAYLAMLWRGWIDFGTGALGDMGCHVLDPLMWALKLGHPTSVEASSSIFVPRITWQKQRNKETYPRGSVVRYQFPARGELPPLKLTWYDGGLMPEIPAELPEVQDPTEMGDAYGGFLVVGDKGKILADSHGAGRPRLLPESLHKNYQRPAKTLKRSPGHHEEWIRACKGGEPAGSNFVDYAGLLTEVVLVGNVAVRLGKKLEWDGPNLRFTNLPEANDLLHYEYRRGWVL